METKSGPYESGGSSGVNLAESADIGPLLSDVSHWYSTPITSLVRLPRQYLNSLIDNLPRIHAQWAQILSEAALFPHISEEARQDRRRIWQQVLNGSKHIISNIREAILMGDASIEEMKTLLPDAKIAMSFEDAEEFFR